MLKLLRKILGFPFSKEAIFLGFGIVWMVNALEIVFGYVNKTLHYVSIWVVFILGCMILLGVVVNFVEGGADGRPHKRI